MGRGPIVAYKRSWSENSKGRGDQTLKTTIQPLSLCSQIRERNSREGRLHDVDSIAYLRSKTVQPMGGSSGNSPIALRTYDKFNGLNGAQRLNDWNVRQCVEFAARMASNIRAIGLSIKK